MPVVKKDEFNQGSRDTSSYVGVREGLAAAMWEAGYHSPQELWDDMSALNWAGGDRTGHYMRTLGEEHFFDCVYGKSFNCSHYGHEAKNEFNAWPDYISSFLGKDTEDLFGVSRLSKSMGHYNTPQELLIFEEGGHRKTEIRSRAELIDFLEKDDPKRLQRQELEDQIGIQALFAREVTLVDDCVLEEREQSEVIRKVLATLSERESFILKARLGFDGEESVSLRDLGERFDLSAGTMGQIEQKAILKLFHPARLKHLVPLHDAYDFYDVHFGNAEIHDQVARLLNVQRLKVSSFKHRRRDGVEESTPKPLEIS